MRRTARLAASATAASTAACLLAATSAALPVPLDPYHSEVSEQWVNPAVRPGEGTKAELSLIDAPERKPNGMFHVKLRVTNRSDDTLSGLAVTPRRGPATGSVEDQRVAAVAQTSEYDAVGQRHELSTDLDPGESAELDLDITAAELPMAEGGTYPLLFQLTDDSEAVLDAERFHFSVPGPLPKDAQAAGITALYPISAPVDILPGETGEAPETPPLVLASEQLADQLAPGGRLDALVDAYRGAVADPAVGSATCVALDPALIDTVDRMAEGYTVATKRAPVVEEPKRLRDSWGNAAEDTGATQGRGAEDAAAWLAKVRDIAKSNCTVSLPWANTDVNAVARTGDPWLVREAIERGPFVLSRVLGNAGTTNVVVPSSGYTDEATAPALGWADHSRSTLTDEGISGSWERAVAQAKQSDTANGSAASPAPQAGGSDPTAANADASETALERPDLSAPAWAAAPQPSQPVRVLLAASTVDRDPAPAAETDPETGAAKLPEPADRFAWAAPGVMAVRFQDSLASTLAQLGERPETTGYSQEWLRYDYELDSAAARRTNAQAAVALAARSAWTYPGQAPSEPVLLNPPASWDADSAASVLGALAHVLGAGEARPVTFADYLTPPPGAEVPAATRVGNRQEDPAAYTDSELLTATQQASFINDLSTLLAPDPSIALTRYGFTLPLRRDILEAFAPAGRRSLAGYNDAVQATADELGGSRATLSELRSSVTLIPPGNVYTRASTSSPLLIVARNGMPLPVDTAIRYTGDAGARLNVPDELRIPARGSVTVQMTADLPENTSSTNLTLYLAGPRGNAISSPVQISVRTPSQAIRGWVLIALGAMALALLLLYSIGVRRKRAGAHASGGRKPGAPDKPRGAPPPQAPPPPPPQPEQPEQPPAR